MVCTVLYPPSPDFISHHNFFPFADFPALVCMKLCVVAVLKGFDWASAAPSTTGSTVTCEACTDLCVLCKRCKRVFQA